MLSNNFNSDTRLQIVKKHNFLLLAHYLINYILFNSFNSETKLQIITELLRISNDEIFNTIFLQICFRKQAANYERL